MQCPNCSGKRVSDVPRQLNPKAGQITIPSELVLLGSILVLAMLDFWTAWSRQILPYNGQHAVFIWVGYGVMLGPLAGGVGYWYHHRRAQAIRIHRCGCLRCGYRWQWRSDQPYQAPLVPEPPTPAQTRPLGEEQPAWEERQERQKSYRSVSHSMDM